MSIYVDADLITDETASAEAVLSAIADRLNAALDLAEDEAWVPLEGSPETSIGEAVGIVLATAMSMIQEVERNDYAGFGELILRTPRQTAEPATGTARWAFDALGTYLVPDGSELVLDAPDGTPVAFATVGDVEFTGAFADLPVVAIEPGSVGNNLIGPARDYEPLPHVSGATLLAPTTDGADEELRDAYLERIVRRARRLKLVPVVTDDYADTALDNPSVGSAVAVRLLNLDAPTDPPAEPGHVTVFVRGFDGGAVSPEVKEEIRLSMQGDDRPLGVTVHVGDPTATDITVAVSFRLSANADEVATVAAIQGAIAAAYDPAMFGVNEDSPGRWQAPRTVAERTINEYDVTSVIDDLPGLAKIESVTINGAASVTLAGWAPVPRLTAPATVTVLS